jgi:hypothetical protein
MSDAKWRPLTAEERQNVPRAFHWLRVSLPEQGPQNRPDFAENVVPKHDDRHEEHTESEDGGFDFR